MEKIENDEDCVMDPSLHKERKKSDYKILRSPRLHSRHNHTKQEYQLVNDFTASDEYDNEILLKKSSVVYLKKKYLSGWCLIETIVGENLWVPVLLLKMLS